MSQFSSPYYNDKRGFSLIELVVVVAIIAVLITAVVTTIAGQRSGDKIDRGAQSIYSDIMFIRMRAVSTNLIYRLNFPSVDTWQIQVYDVGSATWNQIESTRQMPTNTFLTTVSQANALDNLEAIPSGLFQFQDSANGNPYVTVAGTGLSKTKSIRVEVGGAVSFENN